MRFNKGNVVKSCLYIAICNISKPMFMIRNTIKFKRIYANLVVYRQDRDGLTCASKKKNHLWSSLTGRVKFNQAKMSYDKKKTTIQRTWHLQPPYHTQLQCRSSLRSIDDFILYRNTRIRSRVLIKYIRPPRFPSAWAKTTPNAINDKALPIHEKHKKKKLDKLKNTQNVPTHLSPFSNVVLKTVSTLYLPCVCTLADTYNIIH